ncbi:hypothetical protein AB1K32_02260 [Metabacillus dongyingensis]|uniref:hypothetical protein n=1 Tax=Metabacillus dongyingensis TaxID=2874282 RepID=UPI003B8C9E46
MKNSQALEFAQLLLNGDEQAAGQLVKAHMIEYRITYLLKKTKHIPIKLKKEADPDLWKDLASLFFQF